MRKIIVITFLSGISGCTNQKIDGINRQINVITDSYPIRQVGKTTDLSTANVIDLEYINKCHQERAAISPASLGITPAEFDSVWSELMKSKNNENYYIYEYGECTKDGPLIKTITKCNDRLCGKEFANDEQNKIWLGTVTYSGKIEYPRGSLSEYMLSRRSIASFYALPPFEYSSEKKVWKFAFYYANPENIKGIKAMEGYIDKDTLVGAKITESTGYNPDGSVLFNYDKYDNNGYPEAYSSSKK